MKTGIELN